MLVLARKTGESIEFSLEEGIDPSTPISEVFKDGPIEVLLLNGGRVKLGITASDLIHVKRGDLK